jgi:hypothetical protein
VTASNVSYAKRGETHDAGQAALGETVGKEKPAGKIGFDGTSLTLDN